MKKSKGNKEVTQIECINKSSNKWIIRLDLLATSDGSLDFLEKTIPQKPNGITIREAMIESLDYLESNIYKKFTLNNEDMWLDGKSRILLRESILSEKNLGLTETLIITPTTEILIPIEEALVMLREIELYSKNVFLIGWRKRKEVSCLRGITNLLSYNLRENYPNERLTFCF